MTTTSVDIVYEKIHFRHDQKWTGRLGAQGGGGGGGVALCVACVIEMMESDDLPSVRKSVALGGVLEMLKFFPGALTDLLQQDQRVCLHFTASLLEMLHTVEDRTTLEQVVQVLVQLLVELQSEQYMRYVLDEIRTKLSDQRSMRALLPTVNFLGKLVEAVPNLPQSLATHHVSLLEDLCSAVLYPDEGLRASVIYLLQVVCGASGGSVFQALPAALRVRVCVLLLQTLDNARSHQLMVNCLGLLKQLLRVAEAASLLMNTATDQINGGEPNHPSTTTTPTPSSSSSSFLPCTGHQDAADGAARIPAGGPNPGQKLHQQQQHHGLERCPLPLILKKLLVSGDETLQVASVQCMAGVLVHSPSQYCSAFILADIPGFLFERVSSSSEVLLWSVYNCLLLLVEEPLFFSQCHSVYGIESLVRSLKGTLRLTNLEVQREGLLLLTQILERQPVGVRLFPSGPGFAAVSEAVGRGASSSSLPVATQAARAATALLRLNHQSSPVQYMEIGKLVKVVTRRCSELPPLPSSSSLSHQRASGGMKSSDASGQVVSMSLGFLLQALLSFQAACRLAEQCASDPVLKENAFRAPCKQDRATEDSLEALCRCLLHCCDVCIPAVTRICKRALNVQVLQCFYSILSFQFTLLPSVVPVFASKLASSGFYRTALEHKAVLCAGNRNQSLNASCCGFLHKLSMCLLSQQQGTASSDHHQRGGDDLAEVDAILRCGLLPLCCRASDWPSLLAEAPPPHPPPGLLMLSPSPDAASPRVTQYCLLLLLHLALQHGDRLLPEPSVFSSVIQMLCWVHSERGGGGGGGGGGDSSLPPPPPAAVLRSALYLLAVTHAKSPDLHPGALQCVAQTLSSCHSLSSIYTHHPALLRLIYRYPPLAKSLGQGVLELWMNTGGPHHSMNQPANPEVGEESASERPTENQQQHQDDSVTTELLSLMEKHPAAILDLLGLVCGGERPSAGRALAALEALLVRGGSGGWSCEVSVCSLLRPALLHALQRLGLETTAGCSSSLQGAAAAPLLQQQGRSQHPAAAGGGVDSLPLVLRLLCVIQSSDPSSSSSSCDSEMEDTLFKLLYHVSNLAGRLKLSDVASLVPALSYLYCSLTLSDQHCSDRAVSTLLSNTGLMELLEAVLSSTATSAEPRDPRDPLPCCARLLLASLVTLQHRHSAQVQRSIMWSLDGALHGLLLHKRSTDSLSLASTLRLLQSLLDVDLTSAVVCVSGGPGLSSPRPLGSSDSALYPLGSHGARCLATTLCGLLMQKQQLLLAASLNCLNSLLTFLHRRSPATAQLVVSQPWIGFLLHSLLSAGEGCRLHPASLALLTMLLQQGSRIPQWDPHINQVLDAAELKGPAELGNRSAHALRLLLTQLQGSVLLGPPPTDQHRQRVKRVMESLAQPSPLLSASSSNSSSSPGMSLSQGFVPTTTTATTASGILRVGEMSICLSDFTVNAGRCTGGLQL